MMKAAQHWDAFLPIKLDPYNSPKDAPQGRQRR
jgi:hypothetical protein